MALKETKIWHVTYTTTEDMQWLHDIGCTVHIPDSNYNYVQVSSGHSVMFAGTPGNPVITSTTEEQEVLLKLKYTADLRLISRTITQDWFGE